MSTLVAQDVMNKDVMTIPDDQTVRELAAFLNSNKISGAPVVDKNQKLVGVVSLFDIVESGMHVMDREREQYFYAGWEGRLNMDDLSQLRVEREGSLVRDIMTPSAYSVSPKTPVSEIARTMVNSRIHRVLVTDDGKALCGIVTSLDLLKLLVE